MTTRTPPLTFLSSSRIRRANGSLVRFWPKITFVSTCPKCGRERPQHGYTRRTLFSLLDAHRQIDAYCMVCDVCWPISESERRAISPQ